MDHKVREEGAAYRTDANARPEFSWKDYRSLPDDGKRYEVIDGDLVAMGSPNVSHQRIARNLLVRLADFLDGKSCEPLIAPLDVKLSEANVFQPDLMVVCDPDKIRDTHIEGAPDVVVEILSPSSISIDRLKKLHLYAKFGVKEYWIVTPEPPLVEVFVLDGDGYRVHDVFDQTGNLSSPTHEKLSLPLAGVFSASEDAEPKHDQTP